MNMRWNIFNCCMLNTTQYNVYAQYCTTQVLNGRSKRNNYKSLTLGGKAGNMLSSGLPVLHIMDLLFAGAVAHGASL